MSSVYGRGGSRANKIEAEKVVEEILRRAEKKEEMESIGVVTFSTTQKDMIEDLLGEAFRDRPELEEKLLTPEEPLFVKNLENVQGDERDVILFSIGYGPDENGKITLNFGPLNRENGWKRLNVAITRAKKEMKIFTSIQPEQMDITRTSARGVENLKEFLEYARRGRSLLTLDTLKREEKEEAFLYSVKRALEEKGLQVDALVGSAKQLLVTTHSPMVLNYLNDKVARQSVLLIYKRPDGVSRAVRFFDVPMAAARLECLSPGESMLDLSLEHVAEAAEQMAEKSTEDKTSTGRA